MTTDNAVTLTKEGIAAQKAGDTPGATRLLAQAVQADPAYEMAWLWLSSCLSVPGEKRYCLDQALRANEQSAPALKGLAALGTVQWIMPSALAPIAIAPPVALTPDQERRMIERSIAEHTQGGWLVVSQTDRSAQLRKPKVWSAGGTVAFALLVICGFLLWYPLLGLAIVLLMLLCADYMGKKKSCCTSRRSRCASKAGERTRRTLSVWRTAEQCARPVTCMCSKTPRLATTVRHGSYSSQRAATRARRPQHFNPNLRSFSW